MSSTTVTAALEVLLAGMESVSFALTVAVFVIGPAAVSVPCRVIVALAPLARVPSAHDTVVVPLHEPCVAVARISEKPAGSASLTVTPVAVAGPLFVTTRVKLNVVLMTAMGDAPLLTIMTSALDDEAVPPLPVLSVLLARFESLSAGVAVAELSKAPAAVM